MLLALLLSCQSAVPSLRDALIGRTVEMMNERRLPGFVSARWSSSTPKQFLEVTVTRAKSELHCRRPEWPRTFECRDTLGESGSESLPSEVSAFIPELEMPPGTWLQIEMIALGGTTAVEVFFVDETARGDGIATFIMLPYRGRWVATNQLPFMHFEKSFAPMPLDERSSLVVGREGNESGAWRDARWSAVVVRVPWFGSLMSVSEPIELGFAEVSPDLAVHDFRANMACPHSIAGGFELVAPGEAPLDLHRINFVDLCERQARQCTPRQPRFEGRFAVRHGEVTRVQ